MIGHTQDSFCLTLFKVNYEKYFVLLYGFFKKLLNTSELHCSLVFMEDCGIFSLGSKRPSALISALDIKIMRWLRHSLNLPHWPSSSWPWVHLPVLFSCQLSDSLPNSLITKPLFVIFVSYITSLYLEIPIFLKIFQKSVYHLILFTLFNQLNHPYEIFGTVHKSHVQQENESTKFSEERKILKGLQLFIICFLSSSIVILADEVTFLFIIDGN